MPFYGGVVIRLSDRMVLAQAITQLPGPLPGVRDGDGVVSPPAVTGQAVVIPAATWAEVVAKSSCANFRTTYLTAASDGSGNKFGVHVYTDNYYGFAVVSDEGMTRRSSHYVLDEMSKLFLKMFVESAEKLSPHVCESFKTPLLQMLLKYSDERNIDDKVRKVRAAVDEVKDIALDNIERVLERGAKIDDIVAQTDELQGHAAGFQRSSRQLRVQLWWNNVRNSAVMVGVVIAFLVVVYLVFCGGITCKGSSSTTT